VSGQGRGPPPLTYLQLGEFTAQETRWTKALCVLQGTLVKDADAKGWGDWRQDKEQLRPARPAAGMLTPPQARQAANPLQLPLLRPGDCSHLCVGWSSCRTSASRRPPAKRRAPGQIAAVAASTLRHPGTELPLPKPGGIKTRPPVPEKETGWARTHASAAAPGTSPCHQRPGSPQQRG